MPSLYRHLLDHAIFLAISEGGNIIGDKFAYKLHDFWKFGLYHFMVINEDGRLKRASEMRIHSILILYRKTTKSYLCIINKLNSFQI